MGIRVNTSAVKIDVNEDGEYITLNFGDHEFVNKFYGLQDKVQAMSAQMSAEEAEAREKHKDNPLEQSKAVADISLKFHKQIKEDIDAIFGKDTCRKVFGDIVPWIDLYIDFFDQLTPYFERFAKDRAGRVSKYNPARTGNV